MENSQLDLVFAPAFRYECRVCKQQTLPSLKCRGTTDPDDPNRFKWCALCGHDVLHIIRIKKSYKRRWDREHSKRLYSEIIFLREYLLEFPEDTTSIGKIDA